MKMVYFSDCRTLGGGDIWLNCEQIVSVFKMADSGETKIRMADGTDYRFDQHSVADVIFIITGELPK